MAIKQMTAGQVDAQRAGFEKWAREPPREWNLYRRPANANSWAGQYNDFLVQAAWETWLASYDHQKRNMCNRS